MRSGRSPLPTVTPPSRVTDAGFEKAAKHMQDYLHRPAIPGLRAYLRALDDAGVVDYIASLQAAAAAGGSTPAR